MLLLFFILDLKKIFFIELSFQTNYLITTSTATAMYIVVIFKFNQGATTYTKAIYSFLLILGMGLTFFWVNINFVVPIYYILEFGTVLFMVVLLKSNTGLFSEIEENIPQTQPTYLYLAIGLFFEIIIQLSRSVVVCEDRINMFVDYFKKNKYLNEFYSFVLELVTYKSALFTGFLLIITSITGMIIYIKQTSLLPGRGHLWLRNIDVFQRVPHYFFGRHKNILNTFRPQ
jgi:hypothetical protein